jgi:hypothetical protein
VPAEVSWHLGQTGKYFWPEGKEKLGYPFLNCSVYALHCAVICYHLSEVSIRQYYRVQESNTHIHGQGAPIWSSPVSRTAPTESGCILLNTRPWLETSVIACCPLVCFKHNTHERQKVTNVFLAQLHGSVVIKHRFSLTYHYWLVTNQEECGGIIQSTGPTFGAICLIVVELRLYPHYFIDQMFSNCGALMVFCGARVVCMRDIFILNEIRTQDKLYILVGNWLGCRLVPVLAPNYKQHILSLAKHRKVCFSLPELYVRSVYLNLFGWSGAWSPWNILRGRRAIKVWEPCYRLCC